MNGMDIIDGSGTIDPANLSNSGVYLIAFLDTLASRLSFPISSSVTNSRARLVFLLGGMDHIILLIPSSICVFLSHRCFQTDTPP